MGGRDVAMWMSWSGVLKVQDGRLSAADLGINSAIDILWVLQTFGRVNAEFTHFQPF